VGNLEEK
jgi:hypothetical protein